MRFPLPVGYFDNVQVSESKCQEYKDMVRHRVSCMLADEHRSKQRQAQQHPVVQHTEWKFLRRMDNLKVYQRRCQGRPRQDVAAEEEFPEAAVAVERGNPSMLVNGTVSGTIEDMLYGISATTHEEMMTGFSITAPPQDAALLSVVERSTVEDPLRSVELLWVLTKLPLLNPRDVCFLKATGVGRDRKGVPYGYMVLHSVDLPECPPFDYRKTKVLRAKMFFSFLFRESSRGSVDVTGRGIFDLAGGEMLKFVLPHATAVVIKGILRGVSCGEAKKLTLLAFRNDGERRQLKALSKKSGCSMCIRNNRRMFSGPRLCLCEVCGVTICTSCTIKHKRMFTGTKQPWREVMCCTTCSQQATSITGVHLGEPEFVVVAEYYSKYRPISSSSSVNRSMVAAILSMPSSEASARQDVVDNSPDCSIGEATLLKSDPGKTSSSISGLDLSFASTLSDLNSGDYRPNSSAFYNSNVELVEKLESGTGVSIDLLKEYAELGDLTEETISTEVQARSESCTQDVDKNVKEINLINPDVLFKLSRRPNMVEWMKGLQSLVEEAYVTAKANEEIMKKSMR
ncbi:unnamed protein product [Peronospora destructor]|uniref:FYVE-type domain-containing protein n=1 Tax=Peronospora destructor TaxID=86335 RepID=A0AAV0UVN9_9STRA|nr:unnamed protein product [Peronospora destructor]